MPEANADAARSWCVCERERVCVCVFVRARMYVRVRAQAHVRVKRQIARAWKNKAKKRQTKCCCRGDRERWIEGGREGGRDQGRESPLASASPTLTHSHHLLQLLADLLLLALLQGGNLAEGPQQHRLPENAHCVAVQVQLTEKARGLRV